jgi:hypothetical protein
MLPESSAKPSPVEPAIAVRSARWRSALGWVTFGLWASGAAWLAARYVFASESDFGLQVPEWAAQVLAVHGAVAMVALVTFGAWLPVHVVPRLRQAGHRVTGFTQLGALSLLAVTGYGLYYIAGEDSRPVWSVVHWATGVLFPVVFLVHRRHSATR